MRLIPFKYVLLVAISLYSTRLFAEGTAASGGRGGPFFDFHLTQLNEFDSVVSGNPAVLGGEGFGLTAKQFRLGGGGGGGFVFTPSNNLQFGLGYGGVIGEYLITPWLSCRLLIGGGGYFISKTIEETDTTRTEQKISSAAFLLFYPAIMAEIPLQNWIKLGVKAGYFLPNISKLQSFTFGISLIFGKS